MVVLGASAIGLVLVRLWFAFLKTGLAYLDFWNDQVVRHEMGDPSAPMTAARAHRSQLRAGGSRVSPIRALAATVVRLFVVAYCITTAVGLYSLVQTI